MSWWEIGQGDVIGDIPADIISRTFKKITTSYGETGSQKPSIQEVLDAIISVLQIQPNDFISNVGVMHIQKIIVKLEGGPNNVFSKENGTADNKLIESFRDAFEEIAQEYIERWGRKPRLRELLNCIIFILGYKPEEFLSIPEGISIEDIIAELS